jgi:hypothetical protein
MAHTSIVCNGCSRQAVSPSVNFSNLAGINPKSVVTLLTALLLTTACLAQDQPQSPTNPPANNGPHAAPTETIPAGTRFALVLTDPVSTRTMHTGDAIHAQITAPVAVGDQVIIPAGTFVQGKLERLRRDGTRGEMLLQSASVIFPDGYVANVGGPISMESTEYTAWLNPGSGTKIGAILAPMAGVGIGAAIGSAVHTTQSTTLGGQTLTSSSPKGVAIGSGVGLGIGALVSILLLTHSHQFFVDVGSPMEMTLRQPLTLADLEVDRAVRDAEDNPVAAPMAAPRPVPVYDHGTCFTPGTPGTPATVIPGPPGPNGIPGPPTTIPGTPGTPPTPYPCPF